MSRRSIGYLAVILSGMIFGAMPLLAKTIYALGGNAISLVFWRFFFALPLLFFLVHNNPKTDFSLNKKQIKNLLLVGVLGYGATAMTLYASYNYVSTGIATTLHFIYPILVILASVIFYKDSITLIKGLSGILSTLGILLLYNGDLDGQFLGIFLALVSGVTYAFYVLYIDKSGLKELPSFKLTFYLSLIASVTMFFFALFTGNLTLNMSLTGWILAIILSNVVTLGAVNLLNVGIQRIGAQSSGILSTLEPITSVIIGYFVFQELINLPILVGGSLILLSVVLITGFDKENRGLKALVTPAKTK